MKRSLGISWLALVALAACSGEATTPAAEIRTLAAPAVVETVRSETSLSANRLAVIEEKLQAEVDEGIRSGFVAMVGTSEGSVYETAVGLADIEAGRPMALDTQFRIASMTKPITSVGIMMLVEQGALTLSDPVSMYIPSFAGTDVAASHMHGPDGSVPLTDRTEPITIHQLLTHTAGLGYIFDFQTDLGKSMIEGSLYNLDGDLAVRMDALANFPLYTQPGTEWRYSYATDVLGRVIEVASGKSLSQFMQEEIFDPSGDEGYRVLS